MKTYKNYKPGRYGEYVTTLYNRRTKCYEYVYHKTENGAENFWERYVADSNVYDEYKSRMAKLIR